MLVWEFGVGDLEVMSEDLKSFSLLFGTHNPPSPPFYTFSVASLASQGNSSYLCVSTALKRLWNLSSVVKKSGGTSRGLATLPSLLLGSQFIQPPELTWWLPWPWAGVSALLISRSEQAGLHPGPHGEGSGLAQGAQAYHFAIGYFCLVTGWDCEMEYQVLVVSTERGSDDDKETDWVHWKQII